MRLIETELHRSQIESLLDSIGIAPCDLLIVSSVQQWAVGLGIEESNSERIGMALRRRADQLATIVLARHITPEQQEGVRAGMELRGLWNEVDSLDEPGMFLEHLVLHEAAHLLLDVASETECDRWAFDRLSGALRPAA